MFRQLTVSLLVLGTISSFTRVWLTADAKQRPSAQVSTAQALAALDELRDATSLAVRLNSERDSLSRILAARNQAIEELRRVPSRSLLEASIALHTTIKTVYPRHFELVRKSFRGDNDIERIAAYLVMHVKNRAKETERLEFDRERAHQIEKELATPDFSRACRRAICHESKVEQP
jgi:hypothetical protein